MAREMKERKLAPRLTAAQLDFIYANAPDMTTGELAVALKCRPYQIREACREMNIRTLKLWERAQRVSDDRLREALRAKHDDSFEAQACLADARQ
jgi:hypothetical protein